jgi:MerR family transcriptional regulator, copper efflux regulator
MIHRSEKSGQAAATCSLASDSLTGRIGEWRSLAATALRRRIEPGRVFTVYPNRPEIARALSQLVAAEKECCPFLTFHVQEQGSEIAVELRYPSEFADTLARVLSGVSTAE